MSLLNRVPLRIGRAERDRRDQPCYIVATEDTYAPKQYFEGLALRPAVRVVVLPTIDGLSSPVHVVARLKQAFQEAQGRGEVGDRDEFWVFLDTDHHVSGGHLRSTTSALAAARVLGFEVAFSNPCFELWLLLHVAEVTPGTRYQTSSDVIEQLQKYVGPYDKTCLPFGHFSRDLLPVAIGRARRLEATPDDPGGGWPEHSGSRVYRLLERIVSRQAG